MVVSYHPPFLPTVAGAHYNRPMSYIALVLNVLSAFSFMAGFGVFFFLYKTRPASFLRYYLLYLSFGFLQVASSVLGLAVSFRAGEEFFIRHRSVFLFPNLIALIGFIYAAPAFLLEFAKIPFTGRKRLVFALVASLLALLSPLSFLPPSYLALPYLPSMLSLAAFLAAMLYGQVVLIRAYPRMQDRLQRIGAPAIVVYDIVCTVGSAVDSLVSGRQIAAGHYPHGILFVPIVYIAWNCLSFAWALRFHESALKVPAAKLVCDPGKMRGYGLTEREMELAALIASGAANKEIARMLGLSENTVRNHIHNVFAKTGARSRVELVAKLCS